MYVKGVGMTTFGAHDKPNHVLAYEAAYEALEDADLSIKDVDAIIIGNLDFSSNGERQRHVAALISSVFKTHVPILGIPTACSSGGAAFFTGNRMEQFKNVLVLGSDRLLTGPTQFTTLEFMMGAERQWEQHEGLNFPAQNALVAQQHMLKYGTTTDDLALIAYKNHENGFLNPKARFYNKKVTLEQIKNSAVVASPLRLFDCSISVDGAAAAVLSTDKTDIKVIGSAMHNDQLGVFERKDMTSFGATKITANEAFSQAGIERKDIDFMEVHDAFTIVELLAYEDLGFCKKGEGKNLIRDGTVNRDGKLPVNTSGGLKAKGHPISATGLAQIYEIVKQIRGEAGERQLSKAKIGLAQNIGGAGATVVVNILKKV